MNSINTVIGATGFLGRTICQLLGEKGKKVQALTRRTSDARVVEGLKQAGAQIVLGDLKEQDSLFAACQGSQVVISTASSTLSRQPGDSIQTVDLNGQMSLIDAASAAGVKHFVLVSFHDLDGDLPLQGAKRAVEAHLRRSGLSFTILQPTFFSDVWLNPMIGFDFNAARVCIYGSGEGRLNWISLEDVARFTVGALDNPSARNATFELGGPESLSQLDVVQQFEAWCGRKFELEFISEQELRAQEEGANDPLHRSFFGMKRNVARGYHVDIQPALEAIPLRLTRVSDYIQRVLPR